MRLSRRKFLKFSLCSGLLPFYNKLLFANTKFKSNSKSILISIELRGGNDGLNTIIPFRDQVYFSQRPNIAINEYLKLNSKLALNPFMRKLFPLWKERKLTFALGVGWPNINRSHFKAMDQWSTGDESGIGEGWLAKLSNSLENDQFLLSLGSTGSNSLIGSSVNTLHLIGNERKTNQKLNDLNNDIYQNRRVLEKFLKIEEFSNREINRIRNELQKLPTDIKIPRGKFSKQTEMALKVINTKNPPTFMQMELSGFDTHQNQLNKQNNKLKELSENIYALKKGVEKLKENIDLNIIVTSEFGRRLKENGSLGTDHGSASIALLIGDSFTDKFIGYYPDLNNLDSRGDLIPNLYPNNLYGYVTEKIWNKKY